MNINFENARDIDLYEYINALVKQIPEGGVSTYGAVAQSVGDMRASRAVGVVMSENTNPCVPCHRVVHTSGDLGGYRWGTENKIKRLSQEGVDVSDNKIVNFKEHLFTGFKSEFPLRQVRQVQEEIFRKFGISKLLKENFKGIKEDEIEIVFGVDVAYCAGSSRSAYGALSVFDFRKCREVWNLTTKMDVNFPYISTYLSFREFPVIKRLIERAEERFSAGVVLIDGSGILHPRGVGLAAHTGALLNIPTIGVTKNLLCGRLKYKDRGIEVLVDKMSERRMGYALVSGSAKKPIYISPGYGIGVDEALAVVKKLCTHKIPEPVRRAHIIAGKMRDDDKFSGD